MVNRTLHEKNRLSWNAATRAHNSHKKEQARFLRNGGSTLFPEEKELLGDLSGLRLLHLQCNAGQDTLSLASLGAEVTGVDISDEAISFAQRLSQDSGIPGAFIRSDLYDWFDSRAKDERYNVVFSSYGAVCWLSHLELWAQGVTSALLPGGRFVLVEFHPFSMVFDESFQVAYPYFANGESSTWDDGVGDYVGRSGEALTPSGFLEGEKDFQNPHPVYEFQWGIAEVLQTLIDAGLQIETIREYPYSNGAKIFDEVVEIGGKRYACPPDKPSLPLMVGLVARKP